MFDSNDEKYLKRLISRNEVVLFLGAGFSMSAKNKLGENLPSGKKLGQKLWDFLKYDGEYDDTSLQEIYQTFLTRGLKIQYKTEFLEQNLLCGEIPDFYKKITIPYWYKIYTLNVDDLVENVYRLSGRKYKVVSYPKDEFVERDQSLEVINIIHLHGKLPCYPDEIIFSTKQYAKSQLNNQPLYAQFVYDYSVKPTIFIGTDLKEQLFESYIESREGKFEKAEQRPRSFLIAPYLSPIKVENLKNLYNIHYVEGNTEDFLQWITKIESELPKREAILKNTFPNYSILSNLNLSNISNKDLNSFAESFIRVSFPRTVTKDRSAYLLGASPKWSDLYRELDIPREITKEIYDRVNLLMDSFQSKSKINLLILLGTAGSGKSTVLMRLGLQLIQAGRTTFLTYSEAIPKIEVVFNVLSSIKEQTVVIIDNSKNIFGLLSKMIEELNRLEFPPIIILTARSGNSSELKNIISSTEAIEYPIKMPNLSDNEIRLLIEKLDQNSLLGVLKGMSDKSRFEAFKNRAKKQLLISMKEATNGKNFDEIIEDEFNEINTVEAKVLCICIALNTELGYTNTKQDIVGFSSLNHNDALNLLETYLLGFIVKVGPNDEKIMLRHRLLAEHLIKYCAKPEILREAYIRVLSVLAPELKKGRSPSKKFSLYKSLINHSIIYSRFRNSIDQAREVFDSIKTQFDDDYQFWLQYGSLEVEGIGGDLDLAENYLRQAESLNTSNPHILNAKCNLYYKRSIQTDNFSYAQSFKKEADILASELLESIGKKDAHSHHIYCTGNFRYINKWMKNNDEKKHELLKLKHIIEKSVREHPSDNRLKKALNLITEGYLRLGIS